MTQKTCRVALQRDGHVTIDLGGAFNGSCCGCPASKISNDLKMLGVQLSLQQVRCRLPIAEQEKAVQDGICIAHQPTT